jgi:inhibitor of KinA
VAIGGAQTGIYPSESPGGWNLIGRMNPDKLKVLQPGDKVKFYEVKNEDQL